MHEGFGPAQFSSQTMMNENDAGLIATATPDILVYNPTRELTLAKRAVCASMVRWPVGPTTRGTAAAADILTRHDTHAVV